MIKSMNDFKNREIGASDGNVGEIKDIYFDDHAWVVRYLVVDTGTWLSSRKVLISPISVEHETMATRTLHVSITKEQVENSPSIDTDKPISRQNESTYLNYYGYPDYWGGVGIWGGSMYPYGILPSNLDQAHRANREQAESAFRRAEQDRHQHDDPHLRSSQEVIGYHIHAKDGDIGHVEDILIDDETWAIRYLVLNTSNWWLGHKLLVSPQWITDINWSEEMVSIDLTRESVKNAPPYDTSTELNRKQEAGLFEHYERQGYWLEASPLSGPRGLAS
jgi:sporulation protein YlmC with PRC-barrel domain